MYPNHSHIIRQLERRKKGRNFQLHVRVVEECKKCVARYLDEDGALNRTGW